MVAIGDAETGLELSVLPNLRHSKQLSRVKSLLVIIGWFWRWGPQEFVRRLQAVRQHLKQGFDLEYYQTMYPDAAGLHPIIHYINLGHQEGRLIATNSGNQQSIIRAQELTGSGLVDALTQTAPFAATRTGQQSDDRASVDVIIPTRNRSDLVQRAIDSVLVQDHPGVTVWVSDDGSDDGTCELIERTFAKPIERGNLRLIQSEKAGVSIARNRALKQSRSNWITYLDSDNVMDSNHISGLVDGVFQAQAAWAYSGWRDADDRSYPAQIYNRRELLMGNYIDLNTVLHHRNLYQQFGGFDPSLPRLNDYDLLLRYGRYFGPVRLDNVSVMRDTQVDSISNQVSLAHSLRQVRHNHVCELTAHGLAPRLIIGSKEALEPHMSSLEASGFSTELCPVAQLARRSRLISKEPGLFVVSASELSHMQRWDRTVQPFWLLVDPSGSIVSQTQISQADIISLPPILGPDVPKLPDWLAPRYHAVS